MCVCVHVCVCVRVCVCEGVCTCMSGVRVSWAKVGVSSYSVLRVH